MKNNLTNYNSDALNRIRFLTNPKEERIEFTYDTLYRRTGLKYPNGVTTNYDYDSASQLKSVICNLQFETLSSFGYTYNKVGLRTGMTDFIKHPDWTTDGGTHNYTYDALNRLTNAGHPNTQGFNPSETFTYDTVGNRLSDVYNLPSTISYDNGNRIQEDETYRYEFDANGNQTARSTKDDGGRTSYAFNAENLLFKRAMVIEERNTNLPDGD